MRPPLIRIEVESMRSAMVHAFSEQVVQMDEMFKKALEEATQPEKIQAILNEAADRFIQQALVEETKGFFLNGAGRKEIKARVAERLSQEFPFVRS